MLALDLYKPTFPFLLYPFLTAGINIIPNVNKHVTLSDKIKLVKEFKYHHWFQVTVHSYHHCYQLSYQVRATVLGMLITHQ